MFKSVKKTKILISGESLIPGGFCVNVTNQHSPASLPRRSASTSLLFINQPKNKQKTNKTNQKTNKKPTKKQTKNNQNQPKKQTKLGRIFLLIQCHSVIKLAKYKLSNTSEPVKTFPYGWGSIFKKLLQHKTIQAFIKIKKGD